MEADLAISGLSGARYDGKGTAAVAIYTAAGPDAALAPWTLDGAAAATSRSTRTCSPSAVRPATRCGQRQHGQHPRGGGEMTVKAYDGTCSDTRDVTVTVTDVDGEGMAPLSSQETMVGAEPTASLTDADGGITGENWQWARCGARVRRRGSTPGVEPGGRSPGLMAWTGPLQTSLQPGP